jgi:sulfur dioxygenase
MYRSVHTQIFTLPEECLLYPGHDYRGLTVTSVVEEHRFNPRLGGQISEDDFVGHMKCLGLPHPKLIDVAVPANLKCGRPEKDTITPPTPAWLHLTLSFAGIWEIQAQALEEVMEKVQIIDVRSQDEFDGALGHIRGAKLIALDELPQHLGELERDRPIVAVCRSGARSAQAAVILQREGFDTVANLAGGLLRWRGEGHPVEGVRD